MRIGIFGGNASMGTVDDVVAMARDVEAAGFDSFWMPQVFGVDAITALAVVGREVPRIELGTAVVPTYPRHPMMLAQQALTAQSATGGRFALGIGLSHQMVVEEMWGLSFDKPYRHMREYLSILAPLIRDRSVQFEGETLTAKGGITIGAETPCPILIAALGPKMLELAGTVGDGTMTWMTGPATLDQYTIPTISKAATDAGRSVRVLASLPVCLTNDVDAARDRISRVLQIYGVLPSYRAMLDREGAAGPADVAIIGDESTVRAGLTQLDDIGVTDFVAYEFGSHDERAAVRELMRTLI